MKPETGIISRGFARGKYMFFLSGICCMSYPTRSYLILHVLIYWCIYKIKKKFNCLAIKFSKTIALLRNCVVTGYIFCCLKFTREKIHIHFKHAVSIYQHINQLYRTRTDCSYSLVSAVVVELFGLRELRVKPKLIGVKIWAISSIPRSG